MHSMRNSGIFTARKRSSVQGNVFVPVCHSVHRGESLYDVTSCLAAWSQVPSGGSLCLVPGSFSGSLCLVLYSLPNSLHQEGGLYESGLCEGGGGSMWKGSLWRGVLCGLLLWHSRWKWPSAMAFWYGLLLWPSSMAFWYGGRLVWPSGWKGSLLGETLPVRYTSGWCVSYWNVFLLGEVSLFLSPTFGSHSWRNSGIFRRNQLISFIYIRYT